MDQHLNAVVKAFLYCPETDGIWCPRTAGENGMLL